MSMRRGPSALSGAALLLLVMLGAWLRVGPAVSLPLWFDEAMTWSSSIGREAQPWSWGDLLAWRTHPKKAPLYFMLARLSAEVFDTAGKRATPADQAWRPPPWTLRLPSLIAGLLIIPAAFWLGRLAINDSAGLLAALLAAVDPNLVDQSQQCRMYTLLILLTLVALCWCVRVFSEPQPAAWRWAVLGVLLGLMASTLALALVVFLGMLLGVVLIVIQRRQAPRWRGVALAAAIALAINTMGLFKAVSSWSASRDTSAAVANAAPSLFTIAREAVVALKDLLGLGVAGLALYPIAAVGVALLWRRAPRVAALLAAVAVVNFASVFPLRHVHHFMDPRYLGCMSPALWLGLAAMPLLLPRRELRLLALLLVVLVAGLHLHLSMDLRHWRQQPDRYTLAEVIQQVRPQVRGDEAVLYHPQVAEVLGDYYQLPVHAELDAGFYHPSSHQLLATPQAPAHFDAPATWLIIGMINYPGRITTARTTLDLLSRHYEAPLDEAELQTHLREQRVVAVRFQRGAAHWQSQGVFDPQNP